ncbi:hypothetical protein EYF80_021437 [Liparis tanakae]|uniref:Uncharacterized protein n=1 Tax=Liparis tanakae TaxID=230148 RepID=A0A4Z2HTS0_9TELE|nr:hypothetical protein EYF80_021437 [Liparis tanakae]
MRSEPLSQRPPATALEESLIPQHSQQSVASALQSVRQRGYYTHLVAVELLGLHQPLGLVIIGALITADGFLALVVIIVAVGLQINASTDATGRTIADDKDSSVPIVTLSYVKEHECSSKQQAATYRCRGATSPSADWARSRAGVRVILTQE